MTVTIKDVAKEAKVSISTVSRVINDSKPVSSEVKHRVLIAIDKLGYRPNELARSLVTKKSNLIGVIVTDIGRSYISETVKGIEEIGKMYNYDIILSSSYNELETELRFLEIHKNKQVEGIILISEDYNKETIENLNSFGRPYVYLNRFNVTDEVYTVTVDHKKATKSMVEYLVDEGHENIMLVVLNKYRDNSIKDLKKSGYMEVINKNNLKESILEIEGNYLDAGYDAGEEIIKKVKENNISVVFFSYDEVALGFMNYCYDNGIKIPDDLSVAGYGKIKVSTVYRPRLTTVIEPYYDIGAVAIRKILKDIKKEKIMDESTYLPEKIYIGDSVKKIQ